MPVIANLDLVATHGHHALDVELVLRQRLDSPGLEDDDLAPVRSSKVIGYPIDK